MTVSPTSPSWFVRSDVDGFLGLALDNLIQILLIVGLCRSVLGYPDSLLFGTILPATGLSVLFGNLFYAWQAMSLARAEGRDDRTALPYGINTVSLFAYVFLVMLPVKLVALGNGMSEEQAISMSWHAGMVACLGSGLIEAVGAWVTEWLRRWLPRAALLSTLAGIALGYIALGFLLRTYAQPVVGLTVLALILTTYYGKLRLPIPGGLLAIVVGIVLAAMTGSWIRMCRFGIVSLILWVGIRRLFNSPSYGKPANNFCPGWESSFRWVCSTFWARFRTLTVPKRQVIATPCGVLCFAMALARWWQPFSGPAFQPRSTSAIPPGRPWAPGSAIHGWTASSLPSAAFSGCSG